MYKTKKSGKLACITRWMRCIYTYNRDGGKGSSHEPLFRKLVWWRRYIAMLLLINAVKCVLDGSSSSSSKVHAVMWILECVRRWGGSLLVVMPINDLCSPKSPLKTRSVALFSMTNRVKIHWFYGAQGSPREKYIYKSSATQQGVCIFISKAIGNDLI